MLAAMAATGIGLGITEAIFLVVLAQVALSAAAGEDALRIALAGAELSLTFGKAAALLAALLPLRLVISLLSAFVTARFSSRTVGTTRRDLVTAYLQAPWAVQANEPPGRLQELAAGYTERLVIVLTNLSLLLTALVNLAVLVCAALLVDPVATGAVFGVVASLGLSLRPVRSAIRRRSRVTASSNLSFVTELADLSSAGLEVKSFQVEKGVSRYLGERIERNAEDRFRSAFMVGILQPSYTTLVFGAVVLAMVALQRANGDGSFSAVLLIMLRSVSYVQIIQTGSGALHAAAPYLEDLWRQFEKYRVTGRAAGSFDQHVETIALDAVTFEYQPGKPVLHGVSLELDRHEVLGVVGPSGSGKSTLVQILLRLRQPTTGRLLVNGCDAAKLPLDGWARRVTFVPQDFQLIRGTVFENVRFFRDDVDDQVIINACQRAHLHKDIESWPDGFQTHLGTGDRQLSGGQRQRLAIARALVERPDLLILDEPTSALDVRSEVLIRETLSDLRSDMTVVIIAHRLSTLTICDRIAVVQAGHIVACDTPEAVQKDSSFYREALELSRTHG